MSTILIFPAPSLKGLEHGTSGAIGHRIAGMAKMPPDALTQHYTLENARDYFPGAPPEKGDVTSIEAAREGVDRLVEYIRDKDFDRLIFVGRGVAEDFGLDVGSAGGYLTWFRTGATGPRVWLAILPHPSPINKWYNDPQNRAAAALFLQLEIRSRGQAPVPQAEIVGGDDDGTEAESSRRQF